MSLIDLENISPSAMTIISVSLILICGFLLTRVTKVLKLPNVTAYIIAGILIGPYVLNLIPESFVEGTEFLPDVALSFIAFSTGQFFRLDTLKKGGIKVIGITVCESLLAFVLVFIVTRFALGLSLPFSIVLSALATATAPASTMMTIRQTHAHGDFVDTLLQVVALDDVVGLLAYSIAITIAQSFLQGGSFNVMNIVTPLISNSLAVALGAVFGLLIKLFLQDKRSTDNRLIIAIAMIFGYCGICTLFDISPLLGCMMMSTVYINISDDDRLFKQINYFSPPLLLLFFVRSGVNFNLSALFAGQASVGNFPLILIGFIYFFVRMVGKYLGSYLGCTWAEKADSIRNYLGFALFPQAGVAIGLAALGARILGGQAGSALNTIILSSSILYELFGPACAKFALYKSGSYSDKLEDLTSVEERDENGEIKTPLELLIERIHEIQKHLPEHEIDENEEAFEEAYDEMYESITKPTRRRKTR